MLYISFFFCTFAVRIVVRIRRTHVKFKNLVVEKDFLNMEVFYVNSETHQKEDVNNALMKAINLLQANSNIKTITFLIGQQSNVELLSPLSFYSLFQKQNGFVSREGITIRYRTVQNYQPQYVFAGNEPSEILIPLCVSSTQLYKYEDYSDIAY